MDSEALKLRAAVARQVLQSRLFLSRTGPSGGEGVSLRRGLRLPLRVLVDPEVSKRLVSSRESGTRTHRLFALSVWWLWVRSAACPCHVCLGLAARDVSSGDRHINQFFFSRVISINLVTANMTTNFTDYVTVTQAL